MNITSLNLQGFTDWEARKPNVISYLKETAPDVIFFQEVVFIPTISRHNQVQQLNQTLGYPYEQSVISRLQPSPHYETYREGLALMSKHPILSSETIVLKQYPGDEHNRIVQLVELDVNGVRKRFANVHLSLSDVVDYATPHLKEVLEIIGDVPTIIGGDFNLSSLESSRHLWEEQYTSTADDAYVTFPSENKRVDYFLLPKGVQLKKVSTSPDGLSDHRALTIGLSDGGE